MTAREERVHALLYGCDDRAELCGRLVDAEDENAKLRELVLDMLRYYAMPNSIDYKREAALLERAHELGVEVDDA